jgi:hypothetical protein
MVIHKCQLQNNIFEHTNFWDLMPIVWWNFTDVSREHTVSIFKVKEQAKQVSNTLQNAWYHNSEDSSLHIVLFIVTVMRTSNLAKNFVDCNMTNGYGRSG